MNEGLQKTRQYTLLTWSLLTIEILATAFLYATLNTFGVSQNASFLIASVSALILVVLGLAFTHKIYPKWKEKRIEVSLLEDYNSLSERNISETQTWKLYREMFKHYISLHGNPTPLSRCSYIIERNWINSSLLSADKPSVRLIIFDNVLFIYEDIHGQHSTFMINDANKIMAFDTISKLAHEIKVSSSFQIKQKQEQIELIDQITKEVFKPSPNRTLLRALIDGLVSVFRTKPDMEKAASEARSLTNYLEAETEISH